MYILFEEKVTGRRERTRDGVHVAFDSEVAAAFNGVHIAHHLEPRIHKLHHHILSWEPKIT